jgi:hypothetical protein
MTGERQRMVIDLVADSHSILDRWRNYFSWIFNVRGDNDVRQTEIHTEEPPVPLRSRWPLKSVKGTNYQVLIKFQQND